MSPTRRSFVKAMLAAPMVAVLPDSAFTNSSPQAATKRSSVLEFGKRSILTIASWPAPDQPYGFIAINAAVHLDDEGRLYYEHIVEESLHLIAEPGELFTAEEFFARFELAHRRAWNKGEKPL